MGDMHNKLFQSALPRGERHVNTACTPERFPISIRAPARGATSITVQSVSARLFQSALPRGERHCCCQNRYDALQFQSALPRGERPSKIIQQACCQKISIRAPARGATEFGYIAILWFEISIRAPARGATSSVLVL